MVAGARGHGRHRDASGVIVRRVWVITECYPRPCAPNHCAFAHRQMVGLRDAGWSVEALVPNGWFPPGLWALAPAWRNARRAHVPAGWTIDGIRVSDLTHQNRVPSRLSNPRSHVARVRDGLERRLRRESVAAGRDLLLAQFALPYGGAVRDVARKLGLRYAVQLRGDDVWVWPHKNAAAMRTFVETVAGASLLLAVSRALVEEARRLCGGTTPPDVVVPNGIDLQRFRPPSSHDERRRAREAAGLAPDEFAVLCVGDALVRKGWRELLAAVARLSSRDPASRITVLGAIGSSQKEIDLLTEASRVAPSVRFVLRENLTAQEVAELYRAADVFCLASHWEGMANALLEAMASGLPVIATAVAGHPETIADGFDGLLVKAKDVDALSDALSRLQTSPDFCAELGRRARERAVAVGDSRKAGARLARALDAAIVGDVPSELAKSNPYAPPSLEPALSGRREVPA